MKTDLKSIIAKLREINSDCTTTAVARIWNSVDELSIQKIKKMNNPIASIFNNDNTVIVEFWDIDNHKDSWTIEIEDCHISDDQVANYHGGLALFLNEMRSDFFLINNFYFGLVYDEENDQMIYDEERYIDELEAEQVLNVVNSIRSELN
ncbi:hypothetical protein ACIQWI_24385 [Peribacillus frigoritolerans]